jgi:hypothetical protein
MRHILIVLPAAGFLKHGGQFQQVSMAQASLMSQERAGGRLLSMKR